MGIWNRKRSSNALRSGGTDLRAVSGGPGAIGATGAAGASGTGDFSDLNAGANITAPALVSVDASGDVVAATTSEDAVIGVLVSSVTTGNPATVRPAGYIAGVTADEAIAIGDMLTFSNTAGRLEIFDPQVAYSSTGTYDGSNHTAMPDSGHTHNLDSVSTNGSTASSNVASTGHSHLNTLAIDANTSFTTVNSSTHTHPENDNAPSTTNAANGIYDISVSASNHSHSISGAVTTPSGAAATVAAAGHDHTFTDQDVSTPEGTTTNIPNTSHTHTGGTVTPKQGQLVGRAVSAAAGAGNTFNMIVILG